MDGGWIIPAVFAALALVGVWLGLRESRQLAGLFQSLATRRGGSVVKHLASHPELRLSHHGRPVLVTATISSTGPGRQAPASTLVRAWLDEGALPRFEVKTRSLTSKLEGLLSRAMEPVSFGGAFSRELDARAEDPDLLRRILDKEQRRHLVDLARRWPAELALRLGPVRPRQCDVPPEPRPSAGAAFLDERPAITLSVDRVLNTRADYDRLIEPFLAILDRLVEARG